ncbi:MAG TPA: DnaA/Hda family protein [Rhabdaerophilum sp.]|nr:DnaA/Hda family protein [Rhabdaerophilum sp.]
MALLAAVEKNPAITVHLGRRLEELRSKPDHVKGIFSRYGDEVEVSARLMIASDGLWSKARSHVGLNAPANFSGCVAWRTVVPAADVPEAFRKPNANLWMAPGGHVVHYPVRGGREINIVAIMEDSWRERGWSEVGDVAWINRKFHDWHPEIRGLVGSAEAWLRWSLFDRAPDPKWTRGPLTLLGDAAHPMLPFLAQGAAQAIEASGRRVLYLTAEKFMYGFVASLKAQTAIAFKEYLRGIDVLIIDDAQFLHGPKSQQEFCHTLNALIDSGKQVVVAADRAPSDLEAIEERVQSRLAGGLVVEIGALDDALRVKILENRIQIAKAHLPSFEVPPEVVAHVARVITTNGRDLEGAVNRLLAHATLTGGALDIAAADEAIRDLVRHREPRRVKIEDIQRLVANHYNVSRADILSSRRTATVVRPRQIAMYLAKSLTLRSLPEIGRRFGGRDHTTVLHAVRKIEGMVTTDTELAGEIDHLKRMLQE